MFKYNSIILKKYSNSQFIEIKKLVNIKKIHYTNGNFLIEFMLNISFVIN